MEHKFEVIKKILRTIKSNRQSDKLNQTVFRVSLKSTKPEIKVAVESTFGVTVKKVRTMIVHGKVKRRGKSEWKNSNWKKAIVSLSGNKKIDLLKPEVI